MTRKSAGHFWRPALILSVAVTLAVSMLSQCARALDQSDTPHITGLKAGFAGKFKVGYWTPFQVTITGGSQPARGRVELTLSDGDGVPCRVPASEDTSLAAGAAQSVICYAKVGQLAGDVLVSFRDGDQLLASRVFRAGDAELAGVLQSHRLLIVTLGAPFTSADDPALDERKLKVANVADASELPTSWWGYEGVDAVIWDASDAPLTAQLASDRERTAALRQWVRMGGKLVLCLGAQGADVFKTSELAAELLPGTLEGTVPLGPVPVLETYAEASESLPAYSGQVPRLRAVRGKIEAYAGARPRDLPLVVRRTEGFGEIVFLAFSLSKGPLADWNARHQLLDKLLRVRQSPKNENDTGTLGQVTTLGFTDIAGQLRGALDQFPGVPLVSFWLVAVLILAYIACIGPIDYFVVKRLLGRMALTWLTFGVTVVLFSAGALVLAYELKGHEVRVNQLDVVDFDAETSSVRGTSWATLFSPDNASYDLSLAPRPSAGSRNVQVSSDPRTLFSWMGLPGTAFGGMDSTAAAMPTASEPYLFSPTLDALDHVPVAIWSSKAFVGRWWAADQGPLQADLRDTGKLTGTLTSRFDCPLENCVLFYDRWAYRIRQLKPGQAIEVESQLDPQTIDTYLRHFTVLGDRGIAPAYDRASFDIDRIMEMASWHDLVGGERYTGLAHQYEVFLDLSNLVRNGRAVLVGRLPADAAGVSQFKDAAGRLDDAERQRWTYIRCVFPVSNKQDSSE